MMDRAWKLYIATLPPKTTLKVVHWKRFYVFCLPTRHSFTHRLQSIFLFDSFYTTNIVGNPQLVMLRLISSGDQSERVLPTMHMQQRN
jgi:hypothetical protein